MRGEGRGLCVNKVDRCREGGGSRCWVNPPLSNNSRIITLPDGGKDLMCFENNLQVLG